MTPKKSDIEKKCIEFEKALKQAHKEIAVLKRKGTEGGKDFLSAAVRYRDFFHALPDIVYELDAKGNFLFISNTIEELGYKPDELTGKHFSTIVHPDVADQVSREKVLKEFKGKKNR